MLISFNKPFKAQCSAKCLIHVVPPWYIYWKASAYTDAARGLCGILSKAERLREKWPIFLAPRDGHIFNRDLLIKILLYYIYIYWYIICVYLLIVLHVVGMKSRCLYGPFLGPLVAHTKTTIEIGPLRPQNSWDWLRPWGFETGGNGESDVQPTGFPWKGFPLHHDPLMFPGGWSIQSFSWNIHI